MFPDKGISRMDLKEMCRLCRASSGTATLTNIHEQLECEDWQGELEPTLSDMIQIICDNCPILPWDALPQNICLSCKFSVTNTFRLKRMCEESHQYFYNLLVEMQDLSIKQKPEFIHVDEQESPDHQKFIHMGQQEFQPEQMDSDWDKSVKRIKCRFCNEEFPDRSSLYRHQSSHHIAEKKEKSYICSNCGKGFAWKSDLNRHMRIHTGERPFKCSECPRDFNQSMQLKVHLRKHATNKSRGDTEEAEASPIQMPKLHICPTCNKTFSVKSNLTRHIRLHTGERPHKCSECLKVFAGKGDLTRHKRVHTGERTLKCPECPSAFKQPIHLHVHMREHTGYKCTRCTKSFKRRDELTDHLRGHKLLDSQQLYSDDGIEDKVEPVGIMKYIKKKEKGSNALQTDTYW